MRLREIESQLSVISHLILRDSVSWLVIQSVSQYHRILLCIIYCVVYNVNVDFIIILGYFHLVVYMRLKLKLNSQLTNNNYK